MIGSLIGKRSKQVPDGAGGSLISKRSKQVPDRADDGAPGFAENLRRITFIFIGFYGLLSLALGASLGGADVGEWLTIAFAAALVSMASACVGTLVGFTFAIPRALQSPDLQNTRYLPNTNFEQISDWLTKILVGISLVQIAKLPSALGALGRTLKPMLGGTEGAAGIGVAMCLSAAVAAFLLGYLWTRVTFSYVLEVTSRSLEDTVRAVVDDIEDDDAHALSLVQQQLSGTALLTTQTLADALKQASKTVLVQAYTLADLQRRSTWKSGPPEEHDRVIPVFQALAEAEPDETDQVLYGSLGFALKDQASPDLTGAIDALTTAINTPGPKRNLGLYHWNRAVCRIRIEASQQGQGLVDPALDGDIKADLAAAAKSLGKKYFEPVQDSHPDINLVRDWLVAHDLNFETLRSES